MDVGQLKSAIIDRAGKSLAFLLQINSGGSTVGTKVL
jgi:hypothetical protein